MVRRIGRYEITGKLGDGGFGSVYRGYDPTVERAVAIKVLSSQDDASLISRFRSEAMTAGNLHHKNIVTIYEFGEDNGAPFLAMEYLDGVDLQQIIANKSGRESLTLLEKLEIMSQAAQGLQCAHENGVVHRDVKPANIMRLKDGTVKIMDFGIARLTNAAATRLTQTGLMIGTVYYMAPEQFKPGEVDALCDIWSFGVVFYELLTGVHPFRGDDPAGVMYRVTMEEPPPVSSLVPECPPALAANLQRLLAKDRQSRTQSLEDFLLDTEPLIGSLAKIEIPELLKRAERLIGEDNTDAAQPVVGRILKLDRSNKEARQLREHLRERVRIQAMRPKIDALVREAEERAGSRDFKAALEKLNSALLLDPGSPTLRSRLERIRGEEERARRADEAISRGRRSLNEGDLTGAFTLMSEALANDPGNIQGPGLLEEVGSAMREREIRAHTRAVMAEANNLILIQAYDDAIALLADLGEKTGSDEQVVRRLLEAKQLKEAQEIKDRLNAGINASRELLKRGSYEQACRTLEALDRENPNSAAIEVLLTHARERLRAEKLANEIENLLTKARGQRTGGRFEEALQYIKRALELDPANARAMALQRICLDEAQADRDRGKIDSELEQFQALLNQEKLEEALELADRLAAGHSGDPRVALAKVEAEERIAKREDARRQKIQKGINEAERLLADARPASATRLLANLTIQFPAEVAVHDLLDRAQRLKLSQEIEGRLNAGLNSAQELFKSGNYAEACRALEALDRENPHNQAVEVLLAHARERMKEEQTASRIAAGLAEVQVLLGERKPDRALAAVEQLAAMFPQDPRVIETKRECREYLEQAENMRRLSECDRELSAVEAALKNGPVEQAVSLAEAAVARFPGEPRAAAALQAARNLRERNDLVNYARRRVANGDLDEARQLVREAQARFPDSTELRAIEKAIEKTIEEARGLEQSLRLARQALQMRRFEEAMTLVNPLLTAQSESPAARELLQEIETRQREYERQQACDRGRSEAEQLVRSLRFESAIGKLQQLLADFPDDGALREDLDRACAARDRHAAREEYTRGRAESQKLSEQGNLDEAIAKIQRLLEAFPGDPALMLDLETTRAAKVLREERIGMDALIGELDGLFRAGDAEAVRRGAKEILSRHKEPRASELLDWAEKSIAQRREIRRRIRPGSPKFLWGAIAAVAGIIATAFLIWRQPVKQPEIRLQPQEVVFSYQKGTTIPQPQQIRIEAGAPDQGWDALSGDPWVLVSRARGRGTSGLDLSVNPAGLSAGEYTSLTTVTSGSVQKILRVRLRITEPPPVKAPANPPGTVMARKDNGAQRAPDLKKPDKNKKEEARQEARKEDGEKGAAVQSNVEDQKKEEPKAEIATTPLPPVRDCHAADYGGLDYGTLRWRGDLAPGSVLTIAAKSASTGSVTGQLPGCPVSIAVLTDGMFDIQQPSAGDNFRQIRLTNKSGRQINSIQIKWSIK